MLHLHSKGLPPPRPTPTKPRRISSACRSPSLSGSLAVRVTNPAGRLQRQDHRLTRSQEHKAEPALRGSKAWQQASCGTRKHNTDAQEGAQHRIVRRQGRRDSKGEGEQRGTGKAHTPALGI